MTSGFTILLLLHSQLDLWGSPFFFCFCVPSYISGGHHSSSSMFPARSLGFASILLLRSQLDIWGSPFFFFFLCVPSFISGVHQSSSSSSTFPARSLGVTVLGEIFAYVTVFESNHKGSHIRSSWMMHAGCVFLAGIHPRRTSMSGSF